MGIFTAIQVPAAAREALHKLRSGLHGGRWVDADSYHITLNYLGEVQGRRIDDVIEALDAEHFTPFPIQLKGLGSFGGSRPRAVWAGRAPSPELMALQARQAQLLELAGFALEKRKFTPHVTLARFRDGHAPGLQRFVERRNLYAAPSFICDGFSLLASLPSQGGGPYGLEAQFSAQAGFLPDMSQEAF